MRFIVCEMVGHQVASAGARAFEFEGDTVYLQFNDQDIHDEGYVAAHAFQHATCTQYGSLSHFPIPVMYGSVFRLISLPHWLQTSVVIFLPLIL